MKLKVLPNPQNTIRIDFSNKDQVAFWAHQLQVTEKELQRLHEQVNSDAVERLIEYMNKNLKPNT